MHHSVISMNNVSKKKKKINAYTHTSQKNEYSTHAWSNNLVRFISSKSFGINITDPDKNTKNRI